MYSDNTLYLMVEEVVPRHSAFEIGFRNEINQTCKFLRLLVKDKDFDKDDIYVIRADKLIRKKVRRNHSIDTEFYVLKDDIDMVLIGEFKNYTAIIDVKEDKLCDEHRGIPRLEYV